MKTRTLITLSAAVAAIGLGSIAIAQPAPPREDRGPTTRAEATTRADEMFARMDVNKDGKLDQADRTARELQMFDMMDTDHSGQISKEEFLAHHQGGPGMKGDRRGGPDGGHGGHMRGGPDGGMFGMMDIDSDKTVTAEEFHTAALARFDRMDTNKDGTVSVEEQRNARKAMRKQVQPPKPAQ